MTKQSHIYVGGNSEFYMIHELPSCDNGKGVAVWNFTETLICNLDIIIYLKYMYRDQQAKANL